jgi:hypothetical protein
MAGSTALKSRESHPLHYDSDRYMKQNKTHFKNYALPIVGAAVVIAASVLFYRHWQHPEEVQAAGVVASFAIAAVLVAVTWQYAYATEQMVEVMQAQFKSQQAIHIRFGVKIQERRARVWVRNLGTAHFMVTKAVLRSDSETKTIYMHMVVAPERKAGFFIPDSLWEHHSIHCDVNVTLYYESANQSLTSQSKAYNFIVGIGRTAVIKIYKGLKSWYADCPKCMREGRRYNVSISTNSLVNFEQAEARQKEAEKEFSATCPDHQSQWQATMDTVKEHNRTEEVEHE